MNKFLIQDGTNIYTIDNGIRTNIGTSPITEDMFLTHGMADLSTITSAHLSDLSAPKIILYKTP